MLDKIKIKLRKGERNLQIVQMYLGSALTTEISLKRKLTQAEVIYLQAALKTELDDFKRILAETENLISKL